MRCVVERHRGWRGAVAAVGFAAAAGCGGVERPPEVVWEPMADVNAGLPASVRVFQGVDEDLPLRAWYVSIDERDSTVTTRVELSDDETDRRETVSSFAADPEVCVAVNGGYFSMDRAPAVHGGLLVVEDSLAAPATRTVTRSEVAYPTRRAAIGFDGLGGVDVAWASSAGDSVYRWRAPQPNRPDAPAPESSDEVPTPWNVRHALAAGPAVVIDGTARITADEEVFFGSSIPDVHPRTAAGRTDDGRLILMVVDGRQRGSRGVDLEELAQLMLDAGAVDALNLDGGGSSTLVVNGLLINRPAGATVEREVMSALVTRCRRPA